MMFDIHSRGPWPSCDLSNFAAHSFVFDGIEIASMEGFLQALTYDNPKTQVSVCQLTGIAAKNKGTPRREHWQKQQSLWWKGCQISRHSIEYKRLLWKAYKAMYDQSEGFRKALHETDGKTLTHVIGSHDPNYTILTEREFCMILMRLRDS